MPKKIKKGLKLFSCIKAPIQPKAEFISKPNMLDDEEKKIVSEIKYELFILKQLPEVKKEPYSDPQQRLLELMECIKGFSERESIPIRITILKALIVKYKEKIEQISPLMTRNVTQANQAAGKILLKPQIQSAIKKLKPVNENQPAVVAIKVEDLSKAKAGLNHAIKNQKIPNKTKEPSELEKILAKRLKTSEGIKLNKEDLAKKNDEVANNSLKIFCEEDLSEQNHYYANSPFSEETKTLSINFEENESQYDTVSNNENVGLSLLQQQIQASKKKLKPVNQNQPPVIAIKVEDLNKNGLSKENLSKKNDEAATNSFRIIYEKDLPDNDYYENSLSPEEIKTLSIIFEDNESQRNSINTNDNSDYQKELKEFEELEQKLNNEELDKANQQKLKITSNFFQVEKELDKLISDLTNTARP